MLNRIKTTLSTGQDVSVVYAWLLQNSLGSAILFLRKLR